MGKRKGYEVIGDAVVVRLVGSGKNVKIAVVCDTTNDIVLNLNEMQTNRLIIALAEAKKNLHQLARAKKAKK